MDNTLEKEKDYSSASTISIFDSTPSTERNPGFFCKTAKQSSSRDADISSIENERDLTPGSLDVWVDLPDEIKYDPLLAPFKHRYEEHYGKLDPLETEGDRTIFIKERKPSINGVGAGAGDTCREGVIRLMEPMPADDKIKSSKKRNINRVLRVVKLTALVAGWILLTVSLLLNREKSDVVLHTAVIGGQVKEYELPPNNDRVKVLVTLTGPFEQSSANSSNVLQLWLHRSVGVDSDEELQQDSTTWTIHLPADEVIDFSPSATNSKLLILDKRGPLSKYNSKNTQNLTKWSDFSRNGKC